MPAGRLIAIAAIVIFLMAGVGAVQQGYWSAATASEPHIDFDQNFTVIEGETNKIPGVSDKSGAVYAKQSEINVTQGGSTIDAEGNWSWFRPNGTLDVKATTSFTNNTGANVTGYYVRASAEQNVTKEVGTIPTTVLGNAWNFIIGVMLLLMAAAYFAAVGGR